MAVTKKEFNMPQSSNRRKWFFFVIYKDLCFDVAQGQMNGAPNETRTHSCRFSSPAC